MDFEIDQIQQKKRERIGLVVFVLAIIAIFVAVFFYFTAGHSFDRTAQDIDSNVGQMDGYLTLVFEGDNTPHVKQEEIQDKILRKATDFLRIQTSSLESQFKALESVPTEKASINNVTRFYREKFSTVTSIKTSAYDAYTQGEIFERNNWKFALISVNQNLLDLAISTQGQAPEIKTLQRRINKLRYIDEASLIIVLSPNQKIIDYLDKVDCAICKTVNADIPECGKQCANAYVMRIPETGLIGTITSSPAKMLIGRTYNEVETN